MQTFTVEQRVLAYERRGRGEPLVLIHGFPLDHTIWDSVVLLLEDDFDLILPDVRGFGQSQAVEMPFTMDDLASDVAALLDHLGLESAFLAGHSMGGYISLAFLAAYPQRLRGLGLVASQAAADTPERRAGRYAQIRQIEEEGIGDIVAFMTEKLTPNEDLRKTLHDLMKKQRPAAFIGALRAIAERRETLSLLPQVKFPVVVIHGQADALIPIDRAREIKAAVPHAHSVELPQGGHMPMMEFPQAVAEALKKIKQGGARAALL